MSKIFLIAITYAFFHSTALYALPSKINSIDLRTGQSVEVTQGLAGTVYIFLSAKCPCSDDHLAPIQKLKMEYAPKGFQFIGVHSNADEPEQLARSYFSSKKVSFPVIQDTNLALANELGALKTPHVFLVKNGEVVFQGGVDNSKLHLNANEHYLQKALEAVSQDKTPETKYARALGCVIKR